MRTLTLLLALFCFAFAAPASAQDYRLVLRFTTVTGNDDLRGGQDNVYAIIDLEGTPMRRILNQRAMRWADGSRHVTDLPLPAGFRLEHLRSIRLETTFRGGIDGDNWNMNSITIQIAPTNGDGQPLVIARHGAYRFTGDRRTLTLRVNPELPRGPGGLITK
jgi:hypothetical protein